MKIDTTVLHSFSKEKYLAYIRSLSAAHHKEIRTYATLILTLVAVSFFGIFAIAPTLSTIFQLRKSLADSKYIDSQLQTKITNLSKLQESYTLVSRDLPMIYAAITQAPKTTQLTGQMRQLATDANITLSDINIQSVYIAKSGRESGVLQPFLINITARGTVEDLQKFADMLVNFDRIVTINFLTITTPQEKKATYHQLSLQITAYYRP